ncbi:MAG: hypothetical protein U0637_08835 [Phycisphaerales bacterium]
MKRRRSVSAGCFAGAVLSCCAWAGPVVTALPLGGSNDACAVAGAAMGGVTAIADSFEDRVIVRAAGGTVVRTITRAELLGLCPWMSLDGGPDGPSALALTSSGAQLFISVHDDTVPGGGLGSDAVLRYDVGANTLGLFARLDLYDRGDLFPHEGLAHWRACLYVGTAGVGGGQVRVYLANAAAASGSLLATWNLPVAGDIRGLAVDRDAGVLFATNGTQVYRTLLTNNFSVAPAWTLVANGGDVQGLAWGDAYGGAGNRGLYILSRTSPTTSRIDFVSSANAYLGTPVTPVVYASSPVLWHAVSHGGDGTMLVGQDEDALLVRDDAETSLPFGQWRADEFAQVVTYGRGLISPDGEPAGWVIDGDTQPTQARFHPATPDGACWAVLLLLANDYVNGDPLAQQQVRAILTRYGGLAADNIRPSRSGDGIFRHWIDPATGATKPGWDPEFATLSTMKMVLGASRAMAYYPDDPQIAKAASRIIFRTRNWDAYFQASNAYAMAFRGLQAGGPDGGSWARPFHEGVMFVEQAAQYGGAGGDSAYAYWLTRANHPSASYLPGLPISATGSYFESAFISIYPALTCRDYRGNAGWRTQVANIARSNAAWTDDFGPRFSTVFSAGTTRSDWGGYNADNLTTHPGNVTTFPSLMGLCALGDEGPAWGAYHAYRRGAREAFRTGASFLYRRSDVDRAYTPDSAGLPDVALGALGLAELLAPGVCDAVLAVPYPARELSPTDVNFDARITLDDLHAISFITSDINGDGAANQLDVTAQMNWFRRHEQRDMLGGR